MCSLSAPTQQCFHSPKFIFSLLFYARLRKTLRECRLPPSESFLLLFFPVLDNIVSGILLGSRSGYKYIIGTIVGVFYSFLPCDM